MISSSLGIGPANEKVRQKLMMPFSFIISPGNVNTDIQTVSEEVQSYPRCQKCGAYFSKYCKKDDSNHSWCCDICSHQNTTPNENKEDNPPKTLPEITSDDFQFVKRNQLGEEITVIYLSLDFHPKDFSIISTSLIDFLQNCNLKKPILFLLAHKDTDFSILAPYETKYFRDSQNKDVISKIHKNSTEKESNENIQTNNLPAPVFNLSSTQLKNTDISKFIFSPDQYSNIIKTLEKISPFQKNIPFSHLTNSIDTIRNIIQGKNEETINPIHFVSIIPSISNYFSSRFLRNIYETLLRIDILTPTYNSESQDSLETLPGSVSLFNSNNLGRSISKILLPPVITKNSSQSDNEPNPKLYGFAQKGRGTIYQWNSFARSGGCRTSWRLSKMPYSFEDKGFVFAPVLPSTDQPFVLDIHPDGSSDFINVQITAKMFIIVPTNGNHDNEEEFTFYSSVLRVFNRRIQLSSDIKKIAQSININSLLWLWVTRTLDQSQRDVLAALYRATARIAKILMNEEDENNEDKKVENNENGNDETKLKIQKLVHGCCSLKFSDIMSQDEKLKSMARYSLIVSTPEIFNLVPRYDENSKVAVYGNSVYFDIMETEDQIKSDEGDENKKKKTISSKVLTELNNVMFMERAISPIPDWCKSPDPETLEFIHSLVSD